MARTKKVRLTVGQAVARYLSGQYSERDGKKQRFFPSVCGSSAGIDFMAEADLVFCVGTRLTDFTTGSQSSFANPNVKFVGINVAGHDAFKQGAMPILADAREALKMVYRKAKAAGIKRRTQWAQQARKMYDAYRAHLNRVEFKSAKGDLLGQAHLVGIVNDMSQKGDVVIGASGTLPDTTTKMWDTNNGSRALLEFGYSCMGYEIPAGIGLYQEDSC